MKKAKSYTAKEIAKHLLNDLDEYYSNVEGMLVDYLNDNEETRDDWSSFLSDINQ